MVILNYLYGKNIFFNINTYVGNILNSVAYPTKNIWSGPLF